MRTIRLLRYFTLNQKFGAFGVFGECVMRTLNESTLNEVSVTTEHLSITPQIQYWKRKI
jgi:hypothetical protein